MVQGRPDSYQKPQYEKGKVNLNGYYTVASDGQLTEYLEWTVPFENLLRQDGSADPTKPYNFTIWQAQKNKDGTWGEWDTRSPVDVDSSEAKVRVLNVAPTAASKAYLADWMDDINPDTGLEAGRGIIEITAITIDEYNQDPNKYLFKSETIETENGIETVRSYQYDVLMFGTVDANSDKDLVQTSADATAAFNEAGGGLMFGHDTITPGNGGNVHSHTYFNRFAGSNYLDLSLSFRDYNTANQVTVTDTGFLTSRPWDLEGRTLSIPITHVLGQYPKEGSEKQRVWMKLNNAAQDFYLLTRGNVAMIQTGHSAGNGSSGATIDEAKVLANTLIYLAQATSNTSGKDLSFVDLEAPDAPNGSIASVDAKANASGTITSYDANINITGSRDRGTTYAYRVQAQRASSAAAGSIEGYPEEIWSGGGDANTSPDADGVFRDDAISGLRGYYVQGIDTSSTKVTLSQKVTPDDLLPASASDDVVTYKASNLTPGAQYYVHAFAVDYAGLIS